MNRVCRHAQMSAKHFCSPSVMVLRKSRLAGRAGVFSAAVRLNSIF